MTFGWGRRAFNQSRKAELRAVERGVIAFARVRSGTLTVTDVAAEFDLSLDDAEKVLMGMEDGFRVRSEVTEEGILYYEFPEVKQQGTLESGL